MGWSGRAPAPLLETQAGGGSKVKEHAMSEKQQVQQTEALPTAVTFDGFRVAVLHFYGSIRRI